MNFYTSLLIIILLSVLSCDKEPAEPETVFEVEAQLLPYFQSFQVEAAARGKTIDYSVKDLEGRIEPLEGNAIGQCRSNSLLPDEVIIDEDYWSNASELQREFVVFHELGHCMLDRSHDNTANVNGRCISMMNSGEGGCRSVYNAVTRSAYLDELFDIE